MVDVHIPFAANLEVYKSKYKALYQALRGSMVEGLLPQGAKIPSSRELAALYGISRGTVSQVYEMLAAEGYLDTQRGAGTFVAYRRGAAESPRDGKALRLSAWGQRLGLPDIGGRLEQPDGGGEGSSLAVEGTEAALSFDWGDRPEPGLFPLEAWSRCAREQVRRLAAERPDPSTLAAEGAGALREAVARHLNVTRGIAASPEHVIIVNGSMQAIALLIQLLADPGDPVVVEQPGYHGIWRAAAAAGAIPLPAEVDGQGIVPQPWEARLLFVTPGRQFPTGAVLPLERRRQLLGWAEARSAVIVEDDYDSEFRHRGQPLEPLKALDSEGRVVYIGSFSKTIPLPLRLGYAVLPDSLRAPFAAAKALYEPSPSGLLEQMSLAAFMQSGAYERHLRRMRRVYASRFRFLRALLQEQLSTLFEWVDGDAGLHVFGWWRGDASSYAAYAAACRSAGVVWRDAGAYRLPGGRCGACFGFTHLTEAQMRQAVERMAQAASQGALL